MPDHDCGKRAARLKRRFKLDRSSCRILIDVSGLVPFMEQLTLLLIGLTLGNRYNCSGILSAVIQNGDSVDQRINHAELA